ncbi:MAG: potassium channel family protein, partial [Candidatus Gallimonas sp.]
MKKDFAVIGLGGFGKHLCKELTEKGANVLALDLSEERVTSVAEYVPQALCCDCTKEETLKKLSLGDVNHVIITIKDMATTILITVLLKELGVKKLTARADDESTKKILMRLGAD